MGESSLDGDAEDGLLKEEHCESERAPHGSGAGARRSRLGFTGSFIVVVCLLCGAGTFCYTLVDSSHSKKLLVAAEQLKGWQLLVTLCMLNIIANVLPIVGAGPLVASTAAFIYGVVPAFSLVLVTKLIAAFGVFVIGQRTFKSAFREYLAEYPVIDKYVRAAETRGWRAILIARLIPVPAGLSNVAFAASNVELLPYMLITAVSAVPYILQAVLVGFAARDLTSLNATATTAAAESAGGDAQAAHVLSVRICRLVFVAVAASVLVALSVRLADREHRLFNVRDDADSSSLDADELEDDDDDEDDEEDVDHHEAVFQDDFDLERGVHSDALRGVAAR